MQFGGPYLPGSGVRRPKQALYIGIFLFAIGIFFLLYGIRNYKSLEDLEIWLLIFIIFSLWGTIFLISERKKLWKRKLEQIKKLKHVKKVS